MVQLGKWKRVLKVGYQVFQFVKRINGVGKEVAHLATAVLVLAGAITFHALVDLLGIVASHPLLIKLPLALAFLAGLIFVLWEPVTFSIRKIDDFFSSWQREVVAFLAGFAMAGLAKDWMDKYRRIHFLQVYHAFQVAHPHMSVPSPIHVPVPAPLGALFVAGCALFLLSIFRLASRISILV
jgi:hypothetical protein